MKKKMKEYDELKNEIETENKNSINEKNKAIGLSFNEKINWYY